MTEYHAAAITYRKWTFIVETLMLASWQDEIVQRNQKGSDRCLFNKRNFILRTFTTISRGRNFTKNFKTTKRYIKKRVREELRRKLRKSIRTLVVNHCSVLHFSAKNTHISEMKLPSHVFFFQIRSFFLAQI